MYIIEKYGVLFYNQECERYDIKFNDGSFYGGLHCGRVFEIKMSGEWKETSIEFSVYEE